MPSWIGLKFANLGQNNQILYKNREKLENICSIYIWGSNGVYVCTGVLNNLTIYVSYSMGLICPKLDILEQNSQILFLKKAPEIGKNCRIHIC